MPRPIGHDIFRQTQADQQFLANQFELNLNPFRYGLIAGFRRARNLTTATMSGIAALSQQQGPTISPEQAQEEYGLEDIDGPISREYAEYLRQRRQHALRQEFIMQNLDPNQFGSSLFPILGGLAKGFADPVGLASGVAVLQAGRVLFTAGAALGSARSAKVLNAMRIRTMGDAVRVGAAQGLIESTYSLPAIYMEESRILNQEITREQALVDVFANIAGGAILNAGGFALSRAVQSRFGRKGLETVHETGLNQAEAGLRPDTYHVINGLNRNIFQRGETALTPYQKISPPAIRGNKFYMATRQPTTPMDPAGNVNFGLDLGTRVMLTDNPVFARNAVTGEFSEVEGRAFMGSVVKDRFIDLDKPLTPDQVATIQRVLKRSGFKQKELDTLMAPDLTGHRIMEVMSFLDDAAGNRVVHAINAQFRDQGLGGYLYTSGARGRDGGINPDSRHNALHLFDEDDFMIEGDIGVGPTIPNRPDVSGDVQSQIAYQLSEDAPLLADPEFNSTMREVAPSEPMTREAYAAILRQRLSEAAREEDIVARAERFRDVKEVQDGLEKVRNARQAAENSEEISRAAEFCVRGRL